MPENPIDTVARAQRAIDGLEAMLVLVDGSQDGTPSPATVAAILSPIATLLEGAVEALERQAEPPKFRLRPVV